MRGVDFSTGPLGHGLSIGAEVALAVGLQGSPRRVFVLGSDAECNEGSLWEAVMFAAHHGLGNFVAVVDGTASRRSATDEVLNLSPLTARWSAFGWDAVEVDGHDVDDDGDPRSPRRRLEAPPPDRGRALRVRRS